MKKIWMVFIVLVFLFCLAGEIFGGGIDIDFEASDIGTEAFANEFKSEMMNKKNMTNIFFIGEYFVKGYIGGVLNKKTGKTKSAIGIFVSKNKDFNGEEQPLIKVYLDELFSGNEIIKKAREAADYVFQYLKMIEEERKNSIKIPI